MMKRHIFKFSEKTRADARETLRFCLTSLAHHFASTEEFVTLDFRELHGGLIF